jgi:nicotinamide riboside transporter PnuC
MSNPERRRGGQPRVKLDHWLIWIAVAVIGAVLFALVTGE